MFDKEYIIIVIYYIIMDVVIRSDKYTIVGYFGASLSSLFSASCQVVD